MKRALLASVLLSALLFTGVLVAQNVPPRGQYSVYGFGTGSCGRWLEERKQPNVTLSGGGQRGWVLGFVSGVGYAGFRLKETDSAGLIAFVDTYCAEHPLDDIGEAAKALVEELKIKTP